MIGGAEIERFATLVGAQMNALGLDSTVNPHDGAAFVVKANRRKRNAADLTAGTSQDQTIILIVAKDWDLAYPSRPPQEGDQITYPTGGHRYVVDSVIAPELAGVRTIYRCLSNG